MDKFQFLNLKFQMLQSPLYHVYLFFNDFMHSGQVMII